MYWMERNTQEDIYGGGIAGGASQPPMLIALHGKVTKLDPAWHVRHFGWWMGNKYPGDILRMSSGDCRLNMGGEGGGGGMLSKLKFSI